MRASAAWKGQLYLSRTVPVCAAAAAFLLIFSNSFAADGSVAPAQETSGLLIRDIVQLAGFTLSALALLFSVFSFRTSQSLSKLTKSEDFWQAAYERDVVPSVEEAIKNIEGLAADLEKAAMQAASPTPPNFDALLVTMTDGLNAARRKCVYVDEYLKELGIRTQFQRTIVQYADVMLDDVFVDAIETIRANPAVYRFCLNNVHDGIIKATVATRHLITSASKQMRVRAVRDAEERRTV